ERVDPSRLLDDPSRLHLPRGDGSLAVEGNDPHGRGKRTRKSRSQQPGTNGERATEFAEEQDRRECGERIEVILPALPLADEVREAVRQPERRDGMARRESMRDDEASERQRQRNPDRAPHSPAKPYPVRRPDDARIERNEIAEDDVSPRAERAERGDPRDRADGRDEDATDQDGHGRKRRRSDTTRTENDEEGERGHEECNVRLDRR